MSSRLPQVGPASEPVAAGPISLAGVVAAMEQDGVWPLSPRRPRLLHDSWAEFITGWEWQWFGNFTFTEKVHPEKADKLFRLWVAKLDELHLGKRWGSRSNRKRRAIWVRGLEWQKRGVLHYHALIGNLPPYQIGAASRLSQMNEWEKLGDICGMSRIYPCNEGTGPAAYISKYCAKGGEVDSSPFLQRGVSNVWANPAAQADLG